MSLEALAYDQAKAEANLYRHMSPRQIWSALETLARSYPLRMISWYDPEQARRWRAG